MADAHYWVGMANLNEGKLPDAAKHLEEDPEAVADGTGTPIKPRVSSHQINPDGLFNQGVIFWNAGNISDAKKQWEAALQAKPDMADAHYWVGMARPQRGQAARCRQAPRGVPEAVADGTDTPIKPRVSSRRSRSE